MDAEYARKSRIIEVFRGILSIRVKIVNISLYTSSIIQVFFNNQNESKIVLIK